MPVCLVRAFSEVFYGTLPIEVNVDRIGKWTQSKSFCNGCAWNGGMDFQWHNKMYANARYGRDRECGQDEIAQSFQTHG